MQPIEDMAEHQMAKIYTPSTEEISVIDMMYIISDAVVMCGTLRSRSFFNKEELEETLAKAMSLLSNLLNGDARYGLDGESAPNVT